MTITPTTQSQLNSTVLFENELKNLLKKAYYKEVSQEIQIKMSAVIAEVEQFSIQHKIEIDSEIEMLEGELMTKEEILENIIKASGYTKWKSSATILDDNDVKELKEHYKIDFKEVKIPLYFFSMQTNDRNTLSEIVITVLPSFLKVEMRSSSVGYVLEGLVESKKLARELKYEFKYNN